MSAFLCGAKYLSNTYPSEKATSYSNLSLLNSSSNRGKVQSCFLRPLCLRLLARNSSESLLNILYPCPASIAFNSPWCIHSRIVLGVTHTQCCYGSG